VLGLAALGVAGFVLVALPYVAPGSDTIYAIARGDRFAHGDIPEFPHSLPAKHPLQLVVATVVSLLGGGAALGIYAVLSVLAFLALLYTVFRLGSVVSSPGIGLLAAALLATRPEVVGFASGCFPDVPFAALVLYAAALAIEDIERHWRKALVLLALAGLLRPEAWALSILFGGWLVTRERWGQPALNANAYGIAALAMAAPIAWMLFDLIATGDPLDSSQKVIPSGDGGAFRGVLPGFYLGGIPELIGWPLTVLGAVAGAYALWRLRRSKTGGPADPVTGLVLVMLGLLVSYTGLAVFGVGFSERFFIPAGAILIVLATALVAVRRVPPIALALTVTAVAVGVGLPGDLSAIGDALDTQHTRHRRNANLADLAGDGAVQAAARSCDRLFVVAPRDTHASRVGPPIVATRLDLDPAAIEARRRRRLERGEGAFLWSAKPPPDSTFQSRHGRWRFASGCAGLGGTS
jgi:hypothetical protein